MSVISALFVLLVWALWEGEGIEVNKPNKEVSVDLDPIFAKVVEGQYDKDQELLFPIRYKQIKGLFLSYGKVNTHGSAETGTLRRDFAVPDNNGFVTAWTTELLLEAHALGSIDLKQNYAVLNNSVHALLGCRDQNQPANAPVYAFWTQIRNPSGYWEEYPTNFVEPLEQFSSVDDAVHWVLKTLGLESLWEKLDLQLVDFFVKTAVESFIIPGDFDDSAVHLTMGLRLREDFPELAAEWTAKNKEFGVLSKVWTEFAYQPYSNDDNVNGIDPRTYYWIRGFVQQHAKSGAPLRLISTWVSNLAINNETMHKGVRMPFNANNVDASVVANGVLGIVTAALKMTPDELKPFWTPELEGLLLNSTNLITWVIESGIAEERTDLVLLYYPAIYNFYWFSARSLFALRTSTYANPLLDEVFQLLKGALEGTGTKLLLAKRNDDPVNQWSYWDDFLGNNDTIDGKVVNDGEDRLFSTAVALNGLLDVWTTKTDTCMRRWLDETPQEVLTASLGAVRFLNRFLLDTTYLPENCFFSGSVKGLNSIPFYYPGNAIFTPNGTHVPPTNASDANSDLTDIVRGVIDEATYQQLIQQQWFGQSVPVSWFGFNGDGVYFPFWSSPPFTYATSLLALSKWQTATLCLTESI